MTKKQISLWEQILSELKIDFNKQNELYYLLKNNQQEVLQTEGFSLAACLVRLTQTNIIKSIVE